MFTKQPTPCFCSAHRQQSRSVCLWTRGYRGNKRRAHHPMVLVVGNQLGRCDIETAPSRGSYDESCCPSTDSHPIGVLYILSAHGTYLNLTAACVASQ